MLKIALISDIHNGPVSGTKNGLVAPQLIGEFVEFVNTEEPDVVIDLGDRINSVNKPTDIKSLTEVATLFQQVLAPQVHILGNHDIDVLSVEDNAKILECSFDSRVETIAGHSLVYWNGNVHMDEETGLALDVSDITWLEETLESVAYPAIVISHVPLDNDSMVDDLLFAEHMEKSHEHYPPEQGKQCRDIIEQSGKVIVCFNGHTHWSVHRCIDGTPYVTLPSLTETLLTQPDTYAAWTLLQIERESISVEILGNNPEQYTVPIPERVCT